MVDINWPLSHNPGLHAPEGTGKLINVFIESRGDGTPVWRRVPGCTVFARAPSSGFANLDFDANARGGQFFSTFFEMVGSTTKTTDLTEATITVDYPPSVTTGDLIFVGIACDNVLDTPDMAGWTTYATSVSFMAARLWSKVCTGDMTATFTVATTTSSALTLLTWAIRGADQTNPICDTGTISTGASGDPRPAAFTVTTAAALLMTVAWIDDDAVTQSTATIAPTTLTVSAATTFGCGGELYSVSTGTTGTAAASILVAFRPMASTVAITAFSTWTAAAADDEWATFNLSIRHD